MSLSPLELFVRHCENALESPYVLGATGPENYDCSGLPYSAAQNCCTQSIPRTSTEQYDIGVEIEKTELKRGDFVFFDTGWTDRVPNHVGIYLGEGKFVNANSYHNKTVIDAIDSPYWQQCWHGAKRVFNEDGSLFEMSVGESSPFPDVSLLHPEYEFIKTLSQNGVINGDSDTGKFRPDDHLNRAEAVKMTLEHLNIDISNTQDIELPFKDLEENAWYIPYLKCAFSKRMINGYDDQTFRPANLVTRSEAVKIIFTAQGKFFEAGAREAWDTYYLQEALDREMLLAPQNSSQTGITPITRGEMCRALCKS